MPGVKKESLIKMVIEEDPRGEKAIRKATFLARKSRKIDTWAEKSKIK